MSIVLLALKRLMGWDDNGRQSQPTTTGSDLSVQNGNSSKTISSDGQTAVKNSMTSIA